MYSIIMKISNGVLMTCHSLTYEDALKSLRSRISVQIFPTTSRLLIFCQLSIFTATSCPVYSCFSTFTLLKVLTPKRVHQEGSSPDLLCFCFCAVTVFLQELSLHIVPPQISGMLSFISYALILFKQ